MDKPILMYSQKCNVPKNTQLTHILQFIAIKYIIQSK